MSDEPPAETNGSVIPVTGSSVTTTPMFTNAWTHRYAVSPAASSAPNVSGAAREMRIPRQASRTNATTTSVAPTKPNSWPMTAKM
jgi:hypothetical protein